MYTMVGKEVLVALDLVGSIVGAVFVILDYVNHEWVGAALGSAGLITGLAIGLAVSGPVGWVVGGAVAALFASTFPITCFVPYFVMFLLYWRALRICDGP